MMKLKNYNIREKQDNEIVLKIFKIDRDYYNEKNSKKNERRIHLTILEILVAVSGLTVGTSLSMRGVGTIIGVPIEGCSSFLASVATLITNENLPKLKLRYTKLKAWIIMITILYEKTLDKPMIHKEIIEKKDRNLKRSSITILINVKIIRLHDLISPKIDTYNISSSQWTLVSSNFIEKYGVQLVCGQTDTPQHDMCFSNFMITHSFY